MLNIAPGSTSLADRYSRFGIEQLKDIEILALLLLEPGDESEKKAIIQSRKILAHSGSLAHLERDAEDISRMLGEAIPVGRLLAAIELWKRIRQNRFSEPVVLSNPDIIAAAYGPRMQSVQRQQYVLVLMDSSMRWIRDIVFSNGMSEDILLSPREVFGHALPYTPGSIVLVHNHMDGKSEPSLVDRAVTRRLILAGQILGVRFVDHVIVGTNSYYSFAEAGLIEETDQSLSPAMRDVLTEIEKKEPSPEVAPEPICIHDLDL